jgi:AcrR family transcriptional regulator
MEEKVKTSHPLIEWFGDSEWVFPPTQSRSRESLEKILLSARDLFVDKGYDQTSIADISRHSGVSVGSIYHRFSDKQAILYEVLDAYRHTRFAQVDELTNLERWQDSSARAILDFHIEIIFSSARRDAGFYRLIESRRMVDPIVRDMQIRWDDYVCEVMARLYNLYAHQLCVADVTIATRHLHLIIRGSVLWAILSKPTGEHSLNIFSNEYRDEAYNMASRYLGL